MSDVTSVVDRVWQALADDDLRSLRPERFRQMTEARGLAAEDALEAWDEFRCRREETLFADE